MVAQTETKTRPKIVYDERPLKPAQVRALLAAPDRRTAKGKRSAALLAILVGGGLRQSEACRLVADNIEFTGDRCRVTCRTSKKKTLKFRTVTLYPQAGKVVRAWLDYSHPRWWVFPGQQGECLSTRACRQIVKDWLREIGTPWARTHTLRKTAGATITRGTSNIFLTSRVLGHSSVEVTAAVYSEYSVKDADIAADAMAGEIHPRGGRGLRS
jgi:integrase